MSWITLATLFVYSLFTAYLVLVKEWSLMDAGLVMISIGLAVTAIIVLAIMRLPSEDGRAVWLAFRGTWRREFRELIKLLLFRGKK